MNGNSDIIRRGSAAKFLSKEQRDWLIDAIDQEIMGRVVTTNNPYEAAHISGQIKLFAKNAIEKCTIKKFPEFEMPIKRLGGVCIGNLHLGLHSSLGLNISTPEDEIYLNIKEFKAFAAGCNEIVKWLDEQQPEPMDIYNCNNDMEDK